MAPTFSASLAFAVLFLAGSLNLGDGSWEEVTSEDVIIASTGGSPSVVSAAVGSTVYLSCNLSTVKDSVVGWMQKKDYMNVLAIGSSVVTPDLRFRTRDEYRPNGRMLQIDSVKLEDSATYECFISGKSKNRQVVHLSVVEPRTKIVGEPTRSVMEGASVNLTCVIEPSPASKVVIEWTRDSGDEIVHLSNSEYITAIIRRGNSLRSTLLINNIRMSEAGNYTCVPSEGNSVTVTINVAHGQFVAGIDEAEPSTSNVVLSEVDSGSTPEVTTEGASRRDGKGKLDEFETEETRGLALTELQRLVLLKQLKVLALEQDANKLQIEVLHLEKERLLWMKNQRLRQTEN